MIGRGEDINLSLLGSPRHGPAVMRWRSSVPTFKGYNNALPMGLAAGARMRVLGLGGVLPGHRPVHGYSARPRRAGGVAALGLMAKQARDRLVQIVDLKELFRGRHAYVFRDAPPRARTIAGPSSSRPDGAAPTGRELQAVSAPASSPTSSSPTSTRPAWRTSVRANAQGASSSCTRTATTTRAIEEWCAEVRGAVCSLTTSPSPSRLVHDFGGFTTATFAPRRAARRPLRRRPPSCSSASTRDEKPTREYVRSLGTSSSRSSRGAPPSSEPSGPRTSYSSRTFAGTSTCRAGAAAAPRQPSG